jgi:hypothetical protein
MHSYSIAPVKLMDSFNIGAQQDPTTGPDEPLDELASLDELEIGTELLELLKLGDSTHTLEIKTLEVSVPSEDI